MGGLSVPAPSSTHPGRPHLCSILWSASDQPSYSHGLYGPRLFAESVHALGLCGREVPCSAGLGRSTSSLSCVDREHPTPRGALTVSICPLTSGAFFPLLTMAVYLSMQTCSSCSGHSSGRTYGYRGTPSQELLQKQCSLRRRIALSKLHVTTVLASKVTRRSSPSSGSYFQSTRPTLLPKRPAQLSNAKRTLTCVWKLFSTLLSP